MTRRTTVIFTDTTTPEHEVMRWALVDGHYLPRIGESVEYGEEKWLTIREIRHWRHGDIELRGRP